MNTLQTIGRDFFRYSAGIGLSLWLASGLTGCSSGENREAEQKREPIELTPTVTVLPTVEGLPPVKAIAAPAPAPSGMVWVPGGRTLIGDDTTGKEKPTFWVEVKPFWMDEHPVTVAEFRRFVEATKYKTEAEKFGDGGVFDEKTRQWTLVKGANWQYPQGPDKPKAPDNHPVTQVSWNDATNFAVWAGKRLPSEFEWEHAARNARNDRTLYPFGNELTHNGRAMANTWNGKFPEYNENTDGFRTTSPVGYYGKSPLGLTDMTGNVWEWCNEWRQRYSDLVEGRQPQNPTEKVQRAGSFLCEPGWCHGYRVSGRSYTSPETALMHVGFRCVKDLGKPS
ncbi:formylglycine-generating enzyme family protein [Larkinella soli]|uniref:formylglycine-generating enzyme family protein n=1 Tax=Larkinella soli TaxID=1770527 RepID=UPI000FFB330B|nr:formylglycine-generating enzyme family protein [Larkinella soli]